MLTIAAAVDGNLENINLQQFGGYVAKHTVPIILYLCKFSDKDFPVRYETMTGVSDVNPHTYSILVKDQTIGSETPYENAVSEADNENGYIQIIADTAAYEMAEKSNHEVKDRKSTRLNSSHIVISYAVFCLKKKKKKR